MIRTLLLLAAASGASAVRADDRKPDQPYTDAEFVARAADCCAAGWQAAELATTNAKSDAVKRFAQKMIDEHKKTKEKMTAAAEKVGKTVPDKLTADSQKCLDTLRGLKGDDFDREFLDGCVKAHEKAVKEFKQAKATTKDTAVKEFVSATLPILERHLDIAKKIQADGK